MKGREKEVQSGGVKMSGKRKTALPPCRVCGAPGGGLHYGVNTCKACKGFFHRASLDHTQFRCKQNGTCLIQYGKGLICQYCRYQKCLASGMSKNAIKIGRYTLAKRSQYIREVNDLEIKKGLQGLVIGDVPSLDRYQHKSCQESQTDMPLKESFMTELSHVYHKDTNQLHYDSHENYYSHFEPTVSPTFPSDQEGSSTSSDDCHIAKSNCIIPGSFTNVEHHSRWSQVWPPHQKITIDDKSPAVSEDDMGIPPLTVPGCTQEEIQRVAALFDDRESLVQTLLEAYTATFGANNEETVNGNNISLQQQQHFEICKLHKEMFGPWKPLPNDVYDQLYNETGVDVDNRQTFCSNVALAMEKQIRQMVKFAKYIPGFANLKLPIKVSLIKLSAVDFSIFTNYSLVHSELCVVQCLAMKFVCSEEPIFTQNDDSLREYARVARKLQVMDLTPRERVLVMAMTLMSPDNSDSTHASVIRQIQSHLVEILIQEFGKRFLNPQLRFSKIIDIIVHSRVVTNLARKFFLSVDFDKHIEDIPLVKETLSAFVDEIEHKNNLT